MVNVLLTMITIISVVACTLSAYVIAKIYQNNPDGIEFNG